MENSGVISMEASVSGRDDCYYRIQAGAGIKYIIVKAGALDAGAVMDMPLDFENILLSIPYHDAGWNKAIVFRDTKTHALQRTLSQDDPPTLQSIWHPDMISFFDIEKKTQLSVLTQECLWIHSEILVSTQSKNPNPQMAIAKVARFPWEIRYIEAETKIYQLLQDSNIAPRFLGHIQEGGRVIGFLLEKVVGCPAGSDDLEACQTVLHRLHGLGILHGDTNRYNFIIDSEVKATIIDFESACPNADACRMVQEVNTSAAAE
ncbi:hypothetical protein NLG97_g2973 [Lecanicillium saksenae]|uniref:Uncharacterized protein n=1 Tax=Lecanicillium saksenae TaxID=468837 RepID=A0ACC1QZD9_9HYPO|nr:hypothetical protein NLG97_g2973 [Lecanicillium saksenae]